MDNFLVAGNCSMFNSRSSLEACHFKEGEMNLSCNRYIEGLLAVLHLAHIGEHLGDGVVVVVNQLDAFPLAIPPVQLALVFQHDVEIEGPSAIPLHVVLLRLDSVIFVVRGGENRRFPL